MSVTAQPASGDAPPPPLPRLSAADLAAWARSGPWTMLPEAREVAHSYGLDAAAIDGVIRGAQRREVAPQTADVGYLVTRHRLGDIIVVMGHREPRQPAVLAVYVMTDQNSRSKYAQAATARGTGSGRSAPKSLRDFTRMVHQEGLGYRVLPAGHSFKVVTPDGAFLCSAPSTPSDNRTWLNVWKTFLRASARYEGSKAS